MLKNIKSALSKSTATRDGGDTRTTTLQKERRKKEKEALVSASKALVAQPDELKPAKKSHKLVPASQLPSKSLGSKKLATVMNRIRTLAARRSMRGKHKVVAVLDQEGAKQKTGCEQIKARPSVELAGGDLEPDSWSFHSALDFCDAGKGEQAAHAQEAAGRASNFDGYLEDSKYVLPEEQCDIPTFLHTKNCDRQLVEETRRLLRERHLANPDSFYEHDYKRMLKDDWTVTRFLLRRRLDPKRTAKLMEECGKFRKQYLMSEIRLWEFPREFHQAGGLFRYEPDRVGNQTLYMRVKMYRRVPEISDVFKSFILCVLEECDMANGGRGTAVIFDLSSCGLQNVDLGFLYWLLNSFRNYCPKGVSYILVYNLPWFLSATCKLAMTWLSETNRRSLRFVSGNEIENFIARENLPDYLGGTCTKNYRKVPPGSKPAIEVCEKLDISPSQALQIKELFSEYLNEDEDEEEQDQEDEDKDEPQRRQAEEAARQNNSSSDSESNYGDLGELEGCVSHRSANSSRASTTVISDSIGTGAGGQSRAVSQPPPATNSPPTSAAVVNFVTEATKFSSL